MKRTLIAGALALALFGAPSVQGKTHAESDGTIVPGVFDTSNATNAPGYCQITVTTSATSLAALLTGGAGGTCSVPPWATSVYLTPETTAQVAIRYAYDATALSVNLGQPIQGLQSWPGVAAGAAAMNLISATGSPVTVSVEWRG